MATLQLSEARLLGAFAESIAYGIYLVTCYNCWATLLTENRSVQRIKWVMVLVAISLFLLATTHLSLNYYQIIMAFVFYDGPGGPLALLADITTWDNVFASALVVCICTIGDAIPIYRVYVVYNQSWKIIIPSVILFIGGCYSCGSLIYLQSTLHVNLINVKKLVPEATAFWAITIAQNIITTSLLVYRIWSVVHQSDNTGTNTSRISPRKRLSAVMKIIAGSGMLYTFVAIITFITEVRGSVVAYPLNDVAAVIVGITFNLIITLSAHIFQEDDTKLPIHTSSFPFQSTGSKRSTFVSHPLASPARSGFSTHSLALAKTPTDFSPSRAQFNLEDDVVLHSPTSACYTVTTVGEPCAV